MLFSVPQPYQAWTYDNFGANPSATPGTSVIPGASSVEGSWTAVASSANIANDVYGIYMQVSGGATSTAIKSHLLDIGVDPAGGTSYSEVMANIQVGMSPALNQVGSREYYFPFFIKSGSSVAVRIKGSNATAGTVRVAMRFYGNSSATHLLPVGMFSESFPTSSDSSLSVTPGNAADGSWASLGTTTNPLWWWQIGYFINNTAVTVEYTYLELAWGDSTNKHTIFTVMHAGSTAETCGLFTQTNLLPVAAYKPVPAGGELFVRARCNNAPDTGYAVRVLGIGG
jgi:hypothetical protein